MNKFFGYLGALAICGFTAWLGWLFIENIREADASIKAGLIGLLGMVVVALVTNYQSRKREINARHFAEKREGYMHMIDLLFDIILNVKQGEEVSEQEMVKKIMPFKKALIIWGSPQIIESWNNFEIQSESGLSPEQMLQEMEKILRAIRKDLGHDDRMLKFGSIWALVLIAKDKKKILGEDN
jgi:hypothetical protein